MLIAMVIAGIIAAGIGAALYSGMFNTQTTETRLAESHDAEIAARYFSGDAASTDPAQFNPSSTTCGSPATTVVTFQWTEPQVTPPSLAVTSVSHVVKWSVQGGQLVREECVNGGAAGDLVMARNLNGASLTPSCTNEAGAATTCNATSDVKTVALSVTTPSSYSYDLSGTLRDTGTSAGSPPSSVPALAPLFLLGGTGTI
jgi:hypothetical protein